MRVHSKLLWSLISTSLVTAQNFDFVTGNPTQCDSMTVTWQGGKPPIVATLIPPNGSQRNTTLQSNGSDLQSYGVFIPFPRGQTFIMVLSDATGFASGGTSLPLTVGQSQSGNNCNTTDPGVDFFFNLDSPLVQCQPYPITGYSGAVQPITISVLVPGGQSTIVTPPISNTFSYNWMVDAESGTSLVFSIFDANGRKGGSSTIRVVEQFADSSCLQNPISSTPAATLPVISATNSAGQSQNPAKKSSGGLSSGAIAGIVVGVGVLIGLLIVVFCVAKRKTKSEDLDWPDLVGGGTYYESVNSSSGQYTPSPFVDTFTPPSSSHTASFQPSVHSPGTPQFSQHAHSPPASQPLHYSSGGTSSNADPYTAYIAGTSGLSLIHSPPHANFNSTSGPSPQGSRFVLHTDITEGEDVVELPPQYSDSRAPLRGSLAAPVRPRKGSRP